MKYREKTECSKTRKFLKITFVSNLSFVHNFAADSWHLTSYLFACLLSFDHISACQNHSSSPPGQVFCCFKSNAAITTWTFKLRGNDLNLTKHVQGYRSFKKKRNHVDNLFTFPFQTTYR